MKKPANDIFTSTEVGVILKGLKDDFRLVGARLDVLTGEVHQLKSGFKIFGEDLKAVKEDVSCLKENVFNLKEDVNLIKKDLTAVKDKTDMIFNEVGRQREELWGHDKRLAKVESLR